MTRLALVSLAGLVLGAVLAWWWVGRPASYRRGHGKMSPQAPPSALSATRLAPDESTASAQDDEPLPPYDPHIGELVRWN